MSDSRCPEPLEVKLLAHVAMGGFIGKALKLLHMEGSIGVTTSLMPSQKAASGFEKGLGITMARGKIENCLYDVI